MITASRFNHSTFGPYNHNEAGLLESLRCPCRSEHDQNGPCSLGNIEQLSLQETEAELGDYEVGKYTEATNDEVSHSDKQNAAPDKWVLEGLDNLVSLVLSILNTGFILSYPLNHQFSILFTEAFCCQGVIGQKGGDEEGPDACGQTQN